MKKMVAFAVAVILFCTGCAMQYKPQRTGLIKMTPKGGYQRCDETYKRGMFNQGLVPPLASNQQAFH